MNKETILINSGTNWTVSKRALSDDSGNPSNVFGIYRDDNNLCLGTVSEKYEIFQNSEALDILIEAAQAVNIKTERGGLLDDGKKVYYQFPLEDVTIGGSNTKRFLTSLTSHDGSSPIGFGSTTVTVSCLNTFFRALKETPVDQVKVVILGQDPYQTPGLAQGLAFSIPKEIKPGWKAFPSSLRNISKAIALDGYKPLMHGDLSEWAKQGVLLLNATLTVQLDLAASHAQYGWQDLTDALLYRLAKKQSVIWLLWGSHAQKKKALIELAQQESGHPQFILTASHPSGLSVYKTAEPFIYPALS